MEREFWKSVDKPVRCGQLGSHERFFGDHSAHTKSPTAANGGRRTRVWLAQEAAAVGVELLEAFEELLDDELLDESLEDEELDESLEEELLAVLDDEFDDRLSVR